jgi:1-acyl-sn-glycerol-3-phosphate acyltransferase
MADALKTQSICIFPEGTSTIGSTVLPFKPNLFESAIVAQAPVYPIAIQYISKITGVRSESPAFVGEMGLLESMSKIIENRSLIAKITVLPACFSGESSNVDRKELANTCQEAIAKTL